MPRPLDNCVAIEIMGKCYVAGGYDYKGKCSKAISCYDRGYWVEKTSLSAEIGKVLLAKSNHLLHVIVDNATLHTYDTIKNVWLEVFIVE